MPPTGAQQPFPYGSSHVRKFNNELWKLHVVNTTTDLKMEGHHRAMVLHVAPDADTRVKPVRSRASSNCLPAGSDANNWKICCSAAFCRSASITASNCCRPSSKNLATA